MEMDRGPLYFNAHLELHFRNIIQCSHIMIQFMGTLMMTQWGNLVPVDDVMGKLGAP